MAYKQCVECKLTYSLGDGFYRSTILPGGYYDHCKVCVNKNRPMKRPPVPVTDFDDDAPEPEAEANRKCHLCKCTYALLEGFVMQMRTGAYCHGKKHRAWSKHCKFCMHPEYIRTPMLETVPLPKLEELLKLSPSAWPATFASAVVPALGTGSTVYIFSVDKNGRYGVTDSAMI